MKEVKTKEKLEDRIKIDGDQMEKIKSELGTAKNSLKKAESTVDKLNETLKDIKVIKNADRVHRVLHYRSVNFRFQITNNCLNTKNAVYDKQIKKLNRELKIKTELRAENIKEINRLQDKINVRRTCVAVPRTNMFIELILHFYYFRFESTSVPRKRTDPGPVRTDAFSGGS